MQGNTINIFVLTTALITIVVLTAIICAIAWLYKRGMREYMQRLRALEFDQKRKLMSSKLDVQEETFRHIAREIHDNISLSLTLAKLYLNTLPYNNRDKLCEQVNASVELLTKTISDLRDFSRSLNPEYVISQGLIRAVELETERIRKAGMFEVDLRVIGSPVYLDTKKELIIFRIVQEAFNNIIKHAKATRSEIDLHYNGATLHIRIRDNGIGFRTINPEIPAHTGKSGLVNMWTRAKMIGGTMQVESAASKGSRLMFNIPI